MKNLTMLFGILFLSTQVFASPIRFRTGAVSGKLNSDGIDLTDWQAVMICHYTLSGKMQEIMKYPFTQLKKIDDTNYSLKVNAMSLNEYLPKMNIINCAYKMILLGKVSNLHQTIFGEIYLYGDEKRQMSEKELELMFNKDAISKYLNDKAKDLTISIGNDGGIILKNDD